MHQEVRTHPSSEALTRSQISMVRAQSSDCRLELVASSGEHVHTHHVTKLHVIVSLHGRRGLQFIEHICQPVSACRGSLLDGPTSVHLHDPV